MTLTRVTGAKLLHGSWMARWVRARVRGRVRVNDVGDRIRGRVRVHVRARDRVRAVWCGGKSLSPRGRSTLRDLKLVPLTTAQGNHEGRTRRSMWTTRRTRRHTTPLLIMKTKNSK